MVWTFVYSVVVIALTHCEEERHEAKSKALNLQVYLPSHPHLLA